MDLKLFVGFLFIFSINTFSKVYTFPDDFEFGVSNAAVQVEDKTDDIWLDWVKKGKVRAYQEELKPDQRLEFWTKPEIEIELAKKLGVKIFRLSIDWQRLVPKKPGNWTGGIQERQALERYFEICKMIQDAGMKVMLSLYHHSETKWSLEMGGWGNPQLINYFGSFANAAFDKLDPVVDYWITFNEPNVYLMFTQIVGNWPPGNQNPMALLNLPFYKGIYFKGLDHMAAAHNNFYRYVKKRNKNAKVSIAHNTANYVNGGFMGDWVASWSWENFNYYFPDLVKDHLDFMGFNYYGSEYVSLYGLHFSDKTEYNDAGRAIDPNGLYFMLKQFYMRYKLPIMITENGTADEDDQIRPLYLVEHLKAISQAIIDGVPVLGYVQWSLTDNFEWSDGYCPKFGLVSVDRKSNFKREPRFSYKLYNKIISQRKIDKFLSDVTFQRYQAATKRLRKMCRAENAKDALDKPRMIPLRFVDWRFKP